MLIATQLIQDYAENRIDTLHTKNLLHLGEDRYLATQVSGMDIIARKWAGDDRKGPLLLESVTYRYVGTPLFFSHVPPL
jgi:hypothetical protein